ncbi:MAG: amine oxidase [Pseudonocardiales bacterium]|nr:amine oxidase [Pseudonocardiales bacterium]
MNIPRGLNLSIAAHSHVASPSNGPITTTGSLPSEPVVIIGAGPAGLTAAIEFNRRGRACVVFEADDVVGGISRTVERDGWRFDIGGHRFFTKVPAVEEFWHSLLSDDEFLTRPRMSRIFYRGKLFDYPLKATNALLNLGIIEAVRCVVSYLLVRLRPPSDQTNFEGWVAARFGWRLYRIFFKTYTEKVWGVPATEIQADWAAQRIKNLSLFSAIRNAVLPKRGESRITSLIEQFQYPKFGPGMMWERGRDLLVSNDVGVHLQTAVLSVQRDRAGAVAVLTKRNGVVERTMTSDVISSMPISALVAAMDPPAPERVIEAAQDLRYRDFLTVALVVPQEFSFPDNWIYIHDPSVKVGRIQNFGSWSPFLVKDGWTCLGLEYFVGEGDEMWCKADDDLIALATAEIEQLALITAGSANQGYVVRMPKAYPVYDQHYERNILVIREWLETAVPNVHPVGRNGMHRYNNADHSMLTAMLTVDNILGAQPRHDVWTVNVEDDYHEETTSRRPGSGVFSTGSGRDAPLTPRPAANTSVAG